MTRTACVAATAVAMTLLAGGAPARAEEMKLPQTAAEHVAMAKAYEVKITAWRAEAEYHREMAATYKRTHPDAKSGARNPYTVKMEEHCRLIVKDVEKLAADAEDLAKFHRLRALELEGK